MLSQSGKLTVNNIEQMRQGGRSHISPRNVRVPLVQLVRETAKRF